MYVRRNLEWDGGNFGFGGSFVFVGWSQICWIYSFTNITLWMCTIEYNYFDGSNSDVILTKLAGLAICTGAKFRISFCLCPSGPYKECEGDFMKIVLIVLL